MEVANKCNFCGKAFSSRSKLHAHMQSKHERPRRAPNEKVKCNLCGKEVSSKVNLMEHLRTHTGERPYKCTVDDCGMEFKDESTLKNHIKYKHSNERQHKCNFPGCHFTAKTPSSLSHHRRLHSDDRPFACPHSGCNYRAKWKQNLSDHEANVHSDDRPFACPHAGCNFRAKVKRSLSAHETNGHSNSKTFACSKCSYSANDSSSLTRHTILHDQKNKKMSCLIGGCEFKAKNSRDLELHMRRHKTILPCPSSGCGRHAPTEKASGDQVDSNNPLGRPFHCPLLSKHIPTLDEVLRPTAFDTNGKPFLCGHCVFTASVRSDVKTHIASAHTDVQFPFIVHNLDDRECLRCKVTLPFGEFVAHCKGHVGPVVMM